MTYDSSAEIPVRTGTFRAVVQAGQHGHLVRAHRVRTSGAPAGRARTPTSRPHSGRRSGRRSGLSSGSWFPTRPPPGNDLDQWLGSFLDGLGIQGASLVADEQVGRGGHRLRAAGPRPGQPTGAGLELGPDVQVWMVPWATKMSSHPLLVVRAHGDPEAVAASVVRFLAGGEPVGPTDMRRPRSCDDIFPPVPCPLVSPSSRSASSAHPFHWSRPGSGGPGPPASDHSSGHADGRGRQREIAAGARGGRAERVPVRRRRVGRLRRRVRPGAGCRAR